MPEAPRQDNRLVWGLLLLLFAIALTSHLTFTIDVIRDLTGNYPLAPVYIDAARLTVAEIYYAPKGAGILIGDRIAAVDGDPVDSARGYYQAIRAHRPGEPVRITFEGGGAAHEVAFQLRAVFPNGAQAFHWAFGVVAWILMPWLAFAVGYFVVGMRPRDPRAWMVLGILAGFSQTYRPGILNSLGWPIAAIPVHVYQSAAVSVWAICMMLFGFNFPRKWVLDRRYPWIKWILLAPAIFIFGWQLLHEAAAAISVAAAAVVPSEPVPDRYVTYLVMVMIGLFFVALSYRFRDPDLRPDDRRRLKLLYWGCSVAMTPMFLLFLRAQIFFHREPGDEDGIWLAVGIIGMCLFPIVMGYVIVVQQAMPVRMVVRQGVQYALARRGVLVIQFAITVAVILLAVSMASGPGVRRPVQIMFLAGGIAVVLRIRKAALKLQKWVDRRFFREAYDADRILGELSEQVRGILDRHSLLNTVARKLSESLHVERVAVLLESGGCYRPALDTGYGGAPDVSFGADAPTVGRLRGASDPVRVAHADRKQPDGEELERLDAQVLLPLATQKELLGFISLGPKRSEEPYSASDTRLLRTVAMQTGLALENSRLSEAIAAEVAQRELLSREIEIAREVQQRLFPQILPEIPALEYAGHCRPARGVGGDYYDFLSLSNGRLGLAIGDVSGKGIPAALLMASLQASVRGQSQAAGRVADLMANVNRLVCDASAENRYATFFYGEFDPATRRMVYTNGGHNPPMLLRGSEILRLETGGPPVGLFRDSCYDQDEIAVETGDILVLFTDGISEAENPAEEEWGEDALIAAVRSNLQSPPSEMISKILEAADRFAAGAPQHDDMTLVVAHCLSR